MTPPKTTSSKKRRRKRQSAIALDYPTTGGRVAKVPTVVTQSQPTGGALSTPSPTGNQRSKSKRTLTGDRSTEGSPSNQPTPQANTNSSGCRSNNTFVTAGPSIRTTASSGDHISFGTQSTPPKRAKLDEVFTPLKKLFSDADPDNSSCLSNTSDLCDVLEDGGSESDAIDAESSDESTASNSSDDGAPQLCFQDEKKARWCL